MPRAMPRVNYFLHFIKSYDLKVLVFFAKLYPRVLDLVATPNPTVMSHVRKSARHRLAIFSFVMRFA